MTTPEARARIDIDKQLEQAGWTIQDASAMNLYAGDGVAVREFPLKSGHGFADYLLFVEQKAVGVVEAKKVGETLSGVELQECNVHTLLRLPTGIFYAQGVKANVLFFDNKPAREDAWTKKLWIYDLRTNKHFTLKTSQLSRADLDEFVENYKVGDLPSPSETWSEDNPDGRWRSYDYEEIIARDKANLDIFWVKDESLEDTENLPDPDVIAAEIAEDLRAALEQFEEIAADLGSDDSITIGGD